MANTFKNFLIGSVGTEGQSIYTVPSDITSVTIGLNLSNRIATQITASVLLDGIHIIKDVPIPAGSALDALGGKIILQSGNNVVIESSAAKSLDVILSVLEQS